MKKIPDKDNVNDNQSKGEHFDSHKKIMKSVLLKRLYDSFLETADQTKDHDYFSYKKRFERTEKKIREVMGLTEKIIIFEDEIDAQFYLFDKILNDPEENGDIQKSFRNVVAKGNPESVHDFDNLINLYFQAAQRMKDEEKRLAIMSTVKGLNTIYRIGKLTAMDRELLEVMNDTGHEEVIEEYKSALEIIMSDVRFKMISIKNWYDISEEVMLELPKNVEESIEEYNNRLRPIINERHSRHNIREKIEFQRYMEEFVEEQENDKVDLSEINWDDFDFDEFDEVHDQSDNVTENKTE